MKKELVDFTRYLNLDVKVFPKDRSDPITGRVTVIKKRFIVLIAKKAIKQENKIIYIKRTIKKDDVDRISLI